jgi:hypothetical protein
LPDDSASVPALQSIDRLLCSPQSMAQLLLRRSFVFYLFLKLSRPRISKNLEIFLHGRSGYDRHDLAFFGQLAKAFEVNSQPQKTFLRIWSMPKPAARTIHQI